MSGSTTETLSVTFDEEILHGRFVMIPSALLRSSSLTPNAKVLYGVLVSYADQQGRAWPGQERLAGDVGVSVRTLREALRDLETAELIEVKRGGDGRTSRYHVKTWKKGETSNSDRQKTTPLVKSRPAKNDMSEPVQTGKKRPTNYNQTSINTQRRLRAPAQEGAGDALQPLAAAAPSSQKPDAGKLSRKADPVAIPNGVKLIDAEPAALEKLAPETGLRRFRAEHPDKWADVEKARKRPNAKMPEVIGWLKARDILGELRAERNSPAPAPRLSQPDVSKVYGSDPRFLEAQRKAAERQAALAGDVA